MPLFKYGIHIVVILFDVGTQIQIVFKVITITQFKF